MPRKLKFSMLNIDEQMWFREHAKTAEAHNGRANELRSKADRPTLSNPGGINIFQFGELLYNDWMGSNHNTEIRDFLKRMAAEYDCTKIDTGTFPMWHRSWDIE